MLTAALFLTATRWKHLKCTLAGEQINKMHYSHTAKHNVGEPQKRHAKWKKPDTHTKGWFQHPKCPGRTNFEDRTQIRDGAGVGVTAESARERPWTARGKETLRGDGKVWNWLCWRRQDSVSLQEVTRPQLYTEWVVRHRTDTAIKLLRVK